MSNEKKGVRHEPQPGEIWEHFKSTDKAIKRYVIIATATNATNGCNDERVVVYRALYGDGTIYYRNIDEFLSEVDHEKYPDAKQRYRFEKISQFAAGLTMDMLTKMVEEIPQENLGLLHMRSGRCINISPWPVKEGEETTATLLSSFAEYDDNRFEYTNGVVKLCRSDDAMRAVRECLAVDKTDYPVNAIGQAPKISRK